MSEPAARAQDEGSQAALRAVTFRKTRRSYKLGPVAVETLALFALSFAAYAALGYRVVVQQHVVVFDALSRLSHAYFVWHNQPPKLAAIGFVWPPLSTVVFLPFAAIKPLATSLAALPLTSAVFAAALLCVLNRLFQLAEMPRLQRYLLLLALAVNPMILFYATNGMSEIVYLYFLVAGVYFFFKWYLDRIPSSLILASVFLTAGILSRYEVIIWAIVLTAAITIALIRQHVLRLELEGSMLAYLAPIAYGVSMWLFFNWLIVGDPLHWLRSQTPNAAPSAYASLSFDEPRIDLSAGAIARELLDLNAQIFAPTVLVAVALLAHAFVRRDLMSTTLLVVLTLNAAFTGILVYVTDVLSYFQLRYNLRAVPLALVGIAWLYVVARRRQKNAVIAFALVAMLASIPLSWRLMQTYPHQFAEQAFTRALATGEDQEGTRSLSSYGRFYTIGTGDARRMARIVLDVVRPGEVVLTDDAQTFSVMLVSGKPGIFFDRIDRGDERWFEVLEAPFGKVDYVLVATGPEDVIQGRYAGLGRTRVPGFTVVSRTERFLLARVAAARPS